MKKRKSFVFLLVIGVLTVILGVSATHISIMQIHAERVQRFRNNLNAYYVLQGFFWYLYGQFRTAGIAQTAGWVNTTFDGYTVRYRIPPLAASPVPGCFQVNIELSY